MRRLTVASIGVIALAALNPAAAADYGPPPVVFAPAPARGDVSGGRVFLGAQAGGGGGGQNQTGVV
jgi:hypothetical protein